MDKVLEIAKAFIQDYYQEGLFLVFTNILTGYFAMRNSRKNISIEYQKELGRKIADALTQARGIVRATNEFDTYTHKVAKTLPMSESSFKMTPYYPTFMENRNSLADFGARISSCRNECEDYLDLECAGYLYVLEKYLLNMVLFVSKHKINDTDILGCIAICDIQKWSKAFDALLVKQLNKSHHRLYSKQGKRWERVKRRMEQTYLHRAVFTDFMREYELKKARPEAQHERES